MSIEITDKMVRLVYNEIDFVSHGDDGIREGLAAVLALPEVRQAIHDEVRRESDDALRAMGVTGYSLGFDPKEPA